MIGVSNAFWVALSPSIETIDSYQGVLYDLYLDVGDSESEDLEIKKIYLDAQATVVHTLRQKNIDRMRSEIIRNETHYESSWGDRNEEILHWVLI